MRMWPAMACLTERGFLLLLSHERERGNAGERELRCRAEIWRIGGLVELFDVDFKGVEGENLYGKFVWEKLIKNI